jgi:hypothetical protein
MQLLLELHMPAMVVVVSTAAHWEAVTPLLCTSCWQQLLPVAEAPLKQGRCWSKGNRLTVMVVLCFRGACLVVAACSRWQHTHELPASDTHKQLSKTHHPQPTWTCTHIQPAVMLGPRPPRGADSLHSHMHTDQAMASKALPVLLNPSCHRRLPTKAYRSSHGLSSHQPHVPASLFQSCIAVHRSWLLSGQPLGTVWTVCFIAAAPRLRPAVLP